MPWVGNKSATGQTAFVAHEFCAIYGHSLFFWRKAPLVPRMDANLRDTTVAVFFASVVDYVLDDQIKIQPGIDCGLNHSNVNIHHSVHPLLS